MEVNEEQRGVLWKNRVYLKDGNLVRRRIRSLSREFTQFTRLYHLFACWMSFAF